MANESTAENDSVPQVDQSRVADRAVLLPAEQRAGSGDPTIQAQAILEDAEERRIDAIENPRTAGERRTSSEAAD